MTFRDGVQAKLRPSSDRGRPSARTAPDGWRKRAEATLALGMALASLVLASRCNRSARAGEVTASDGSAGALALQPKHAAPFAVKPPGRLMMALPDVPVALPPAETPATVGLPTVDFGAPGPLVIAGYPTSLATGLRDFMTTVAFTEEGDEVVACGATTPAGASRGIPLLDACVSQRRGTREVERLGLSDGAAFGKKLSVLRTGARHDLGYEAASRTLIPPAVALSWPHARDLTLEVTTTESPGRGENLKIGGRVAGGEPVFPLTLAMRGASADTSYAAALNAVVPSPDGRELAFVAHFYCGEWCNEAGIARVSLPRLASLVYHDTALRRQRGGRLEEARELLLKATWADPTFVVAAYNLACTSARLGDEPGAERALRLATALGQDRVRERARNDPDLKPLAKSSWFVALTR